MGGGSAVVSLSRCGQVGVELHPQPRGASKVDHCLQGALCERVVDGGRNAREAIDSNADLAWPAVSFNPMHAHT